MVPTHELFHQQGGNNNDDDDDDDVDFDDDDYPSTISRYYILLSQPSTGIHHCSNLTSTRIWDEYKSSFRLLVATDYLAPAKLLQRFEEEPEPLPPWWQDEANPRKPIWEVKWINQLDIVVEGSLEVKLPTIWTDEKQSRAEAERRERVRRKKIQMHEKVGKSRKGRKVAKHCVFPMICGSRGSKSRLAKAAGAETSGEMRTEKLHAVVARSRFWSKKVQNTSVSDHFWKLRCRKSARRCGAKHISKSKCTKRTMLGPLLEVEMSKKCTPLWRKAHFQVEMYKTLHVRTTFGGSDVEKVHAVVAPSTFPSQNVQNTTCSRHFWRFGCWKSARRRGAKHISKSKCTKHRMFAPLLEVQMSLRFTTLHYTTLHSPTLHSTTLHYITQH